MSSIPLIGLEGLDDVTDDCRRIEKFIRDRVFCISWSEVPGITGIDTACDEEDAWSMITVSRRFPDVVLTDIRMPVWMGWS